ncbi:MAG: TIR domain-containing protein [Gammaproteobacteria bacterium]|nr:TIR domain-containing protein [Gammaproteobacteria bacterium]
MADIFVSYSSKDRQRIQPIVQALEGQGWSVWWDRAILPGSSFDRSIQDAISKASCVVVMWTSNSVNSEWVQTEAHEGLNRNILVPVLLDPVEVPLAFRRTQAADISDWPRTHNSRTEFAMLLSGIAHALDANGKTSTGTRSSAPVRPDVTTDQPSIAILHFENLSDDRQQELLADGMTEDITMLLSQVPDFFVIARNSTFTYKGQPVDPRQVGIDLGVRYLLQGTMRRLGDRLKITVQLIETETCGHLWSESFDRNVEEIFDVQDEVSHEIVSILGGEIRALAQARTREKPVEDLDAWGHYLRGSMPFGADELGDRLRELRRAIELDPNFAKARSRLASILGSEAQSGLVREPQAARKEAAEQAEVALRLAPRDPVVLVDCAQGLVPRDRKQAEMLINRASDYAKNLPRYHLMLGGLGNIAGRFEEAVEHYLYCIKLSPRDPEVGARYAALARSQVVIGDYEGADTNLDKALSLDSTGTLFWYEKANVLGYLGRPAEAAEAWHKAQKARSDISVAEIERKWNYAHPRFQQGLVGGLKKAGID